MKKFNPTIYTLAGVTTVLIACAGQAEASAIPFKAKVMTAQLAKVAVPASQPFAKNKVRPTSASVNYVVFSGANYVSTLGSLRRPGSVNYLAPTIIQRPTPVTVVTPVTSFANVPDGGSTALMMGGLLGGMALWLKKWKALPWLRSIR